MLFHLEPRRSQVIDVTDAGVRHLPEDDAVHFERLDLLYRALCSMLYNYVPMSGHPGGSISSGRFVAGLLFETMDYDASQPDREDADIISYAAGHKAMGLYAMWALRDELLRAAKSPLLAKQNKDRLRLEDLLGFRRNPLTDTPLFVKFGSRPLDGHPTPATPFVKLSTGASGVGIASSIGLALAARDYFGDYAPSVNIVEGEGGLTPGRVSEALAAAATASLGNVVVHVDWNQASIDSNHVCRVGGALGEYVQWNPTEFFHVHDWNVIVVPDGKDFQQILSSQYLAKTFTNGQPTAIVYSTIKGWKYGIEGRLSHGAGHKLCSSGFYDAVKPFLDEGGGTIEFCKTDKKRCEGKPAVSESCFWETLLLVRAFLEKNSDTANFFAAKLAAAHKRLGDSARRPREHAPHAETIYELAARASDPPKGLLLSPGSSTTLRQELGNTLHYYNAQSGGAMFAGSADLMGSTSTNLVGKEFADGFYHARNNAKSRLLSIGGICEDAMSGILSGISTFGRHLGVGSSYGAFLAPLGHIAARLHAIGSQARRARDGSAYKPMILICAHAGLKTGEDGPTHADPQALQLLQENFPRGTSITLTPWDPQEVWYLMTAALAKRPAVIAPFVTRPNEMVIDRVAKRLAPASSATSGIYCLRKAEGLPEGVVILQESGVAYAFIEEALPLLDKKGVNLEVYYVASAELFDFLPVAEQQRVFPELKTMSAMGITGFTASTMYRWIRSDRGRRATLHPFQKGHFLGSGSGKMVLAEAGLDGESQYNAVMKYLER
ncbi:MAG: hypothetical protein HY540_02015 [Deltaproteobacteria bacterium]|nr:hypothetical protein [Deltaproteobacteria bacterium]